MRGATEAGGDAPEEARAAEAYQLRVDGRGSIGATIRRHHAHVQAIGVRVTVHARSQLSQAIT